MFSKTLGGRQFWADELFFHDWHIQRNVATGHCRLLDGDARRHAWGTFEECRAALEEIRRRGEAPPMRGTAVVVLHGLARSARSMRGICRVLRQSGRYSVFNVAYPTTRADVAAHARALGSVLDNLTGIEQIHFVAHSLGNIVIRHWLADQRRLAPERRVDSRIGRIVMLGPPNQGARLAEALLGHGLFDRLIGPPGRQLGRGWKELESRLAIPSAEFGVIAGGRGGGWGYNPLLRGDNDMIVTVESTRLAGAADFAVLPAWHAFMMDNRCVQDYTLRFLEHGYFVSPQMRRPIGGESQAMNETAPERFDANKAEGAA